MQDYRGKRLLDLAVVALAALPSALVCVPSAILIKATSPGPVLFRQRRVGRHGVPFEMLKLRTMRVAEGHGLEFPATSDRITSAGRWLRRFSIDELPQLANVAAGTMSIVGPRPLLEYQYERLDRRQRGRFLVRPGITGLAQIKDRTTSRWSERIEIDLHYVEHQSLRCDLETIARTPLVALSTRGVDAHPPDDPIARLPSDHETFSVRGARLGRSTHGNHPGG